MSKRSGLARLLPLPVAAALVAGIAATPDLIGRYAGLDAVPASDSYPWFEDTAAEQLRQDQCLMSDVLRLGGPAMSATAQDGLGQPADRLHELADRKRWEATPLATAYKSDRDTADKEMDALSALRDAWKKPLEGLTNPAGFTDADFRWPPNGHDGKPSFYGQTGLSQWVSDRFWQDEASFYKDPTTAADTATRKAVADLGTPLYGKDPSPVGMTHDEWNRALSERAAFRWLSGESIGPPGADDARVFLASGGFPRTAPQQDSPEYRIAVEDIKSRFAACAWRDPLDPDGALTDVTATAAAEWQQEIASQATQRNQVLNANKDATKALAAGAKTLGDLLGHSWVADHLARWQDYWSAGGVGYIGNAPTTIEVTGKKGLCLDAAGGGTANGTVVQIYTCNGTAGQEWTVEGDAAGLHLRNAKSFKCVEVAGNNPANGTKIQLSTCNSSPAQTWEYNVRAATPLKSVGTGKCLDLKTYDNGQDSRLWACSGGTPQKLTIKLSGHTGTVPPAAQFTKAKAGIATAQASAKKQLEALKAQLTAAQKAATASDTAEQAAYALADSVGAPRGRGLLVGQQKAQVTKGAAAALEAMVKAGETAEAATRASAADSATIAQRALAQAAQSKAEFRKKAAEKAALQAKAAADAAKVHRDNAKKDKETAEAKLTVALKAEGDAKAAAADAHAKRLAAEAEEATAKAEKENAAAKQAEAARYKLNAQTEAGIAKDAKAKAEAAEQTAVARKDDAVTARDNAKAKRDDAWEAEQKADAERAKADAKEAYAQSLDSGDAATAARTAADEADQHATDAESAAGRARTAADAATRAAADADAAATRAEAAAKRARSDADAAQAAKLRADAAVKTATSAAADAIAAAQHAAAEARTAVALADEAQVHAKDSRTQANAAQAEAVKALAASAKAAGFAYVTAQAAADAGSAAAQVAQPANDAVQLGSAYVDSDSAAGLVVLSGQASKTIAEQQKAVADAHAKNAQEEAAAAKALADQAQGDAKEAYQHAANAAQYAADARGYAKEALGYAADAAKAAAAASASLARTVEYDRQATDDAAAADKAAGRAEGFASDARASADQAALDAQGARAAASEAEQAAKDARAAADRADTAATEAEQAAKDAEKYAKEAQEAAERAETKGNNDEIANGSSTGVGNVFYVVDHIETVGEPDVIKKDNCNVIIHIGNCTITAVIHFNAVVDLYLCTAEELPATEYGCPSTSTVFLGPKTLTGLEKKVTYTLTMEEFNSGIDPVHILLGDFIECGKKLAPWLEGGNGTSCLWAASWFVGGKTVQAVADAIHALNVAMHTGIGVTDAFKALKALNLDANAMADIERTVHLYEDLITTCKVNSFPGTTQVIMADGSGKPISEVRRGERVLAADPETGRQRAQRVTSTFVHDTDRLVDITFIDGDRLTSTAGHKVYVAERGWRLVSELRAGDALRSPDGSLHTVGALRDRTGLKASRVYDLTVDGLHTFYVRTEGFRPDDLLVHNCMNLADELLYPQTQAHTLSKHVRPTPGEARAFAEENLRNGREPINSVWVSEEIAQQGVDRAFASYFFPNGKKRTASFDALDNWVAKRGSWRNKKEFTFTARWDKYPSLGTVYRADGSSYAAGNTIKVTLHRLPGKSGHEGFIVYTAYPV
ncbi:RICIN domain-containing protein [Streptomyces sp. DSM 15324]|uniref:RICIN domain-containing protein n=1 Tax=Streptomyces sp. DSM 15324 TaxID=1739111 RepID=UPI0007476997|nr:RICIN domain-containing protein [Streptomyces sp. DSM 15324]KUO06745.1 virulence factor [Streptomyces sp. DSM 15324]